MQAVLQQPLLYSAPRRAVRCKGREDSAPAEGKDSCSFLKEEFADRPASKTIDVGYPLDYKGGYGDLLGAVGKICRCLDVGPFREEENDDTEYKLSKLLSWVVKRLKGCDVEVSALMDSEGELTFVAYRTYQCLDCCLFVFYCAPALYMSEMASLLYKRFIRYASSVFGSCVQPEYTESFVLSVLLDNDCWYEEDDNQFMVNMLKSYREGGEFHSLFKEISDMEVSYKGLVRDLKRFRKKCSVAESDLVDVMLEGMEILPNMDISRFSFNPYNDGYQQESTIDVYQSVAFLYSTHDHIDDEIESYIESDLNCGVYFEGWNRWVVLSSNMSDEDFMDVIKDSEYPDRFRKWHQRYYDVITKFDKYEPDGDVGKQDGGD